MLLAIFGPVLVIAMQPGSWAVRITKFPLMATDGIQAVAGQGGRLRCLTFHQGSRRVLRSAEGPLGAAAARYLSQLDDPGFFANLAGPTTGQPVEGDILEIAVSGPKKIESGGTSGALPAPVHEWTNGLLATCATLPLSRLATAYLRAVRVDEFRRKWIAGRGGVFVPVERYGGAKRAVTAASESPGTFVPVTVEALQILRRSVAASGEFVSVRGGFYQVEVFEGERIR